MSRAKRTALMKRAGPYAVASRADGSLIVTPAWPLDSDPDGDRGPGLSSRMGLAADVEAFLNGVAASDGRVE